MIMRDIIELSAQIGGIYSKNPIINFVYKLRKKKMFKEVVKRIEMLPEIPSDEDIINFTSMYPVINGMDIDGDVSFITYNKHKLCSILYNWTTGMTYSIYPPDSNSDISYIVQVIGNRIEYSIKHTNHFTNKNIDHTYVKRWIGIVIKIELRRICANLIFGGR